MAFYPSRIDSRFILWYYSWFIFIFYCTEKCSNSWTRGKHCAILVFQVIYSSGLFCIWLPQQNHSHNWQGASFYHKTTSSIWNSQTFVLFILLFGFSVLFKFAVVSPVSNWTVTALGGHYPCFKRVVARRITWRVGYEALLGVLRDNWQNSFREKGYQNKKLQGSGINWNIFRGNQR